MTSAVPRDLKLPTKAWALKAQLDLTMPLAHSLLVHQPDSPGGHPGFPHLGKHVWVGVILQKDCGCSCVIIAGRDVQGRETHFPFRPIVDEVGHHILMTLLQSHGQWGEAILVGESRDGISKPFAPSKLSSSATFSMKPSFAQLSRSVLPQYLHSSFLHLVFLYHMPAVCLCAMMISDHVYQVFV